MCQHNCLLFFHFSRNNLKCQLLELTFHFFSVSLCWTHQVAPWVYGCKAGLGTWSSLSLWLWIPLKPWYHLWELGTWLQEPQWALRGRMSVTLQDESFHQASLLLWPCHLGKQMTLMRDGSLSPGTKCTHCSHCATLSLLPPESHRHRSLRKHTRSDGQRQVRNDRVMVTQHDVSCLCFTVKQAELKTFNFQHIGMQKTMVGYTFLLLHRILKKRTDSDREWVLGRQRGVTWHWIASAGTGKGATSLRCEGQTGLISLQWPLKFLPWDINEVIHRKAAARHTNPHHHHHHTTLPTSTTQCNLRSPGPPAALRLYLGRAALCQGRSPYNSPREHDSSRSMAREQEADKQRGGVCSCAYVAMPGEGDNSLALCVLHQQKNNVSTGVSTMVWEIVVLSPYFNYLCLHVVCLSPAVMSKYWGKAY